MSPLQRPVLGLSRMCLVCRVASLKNVQRLKEPVFSRHMGHLCRQAPGRRFLWFVGGLLIAGGGASVFADPTAVFRLRELRAEAMPTTADVVMEQTRKKRNVSKEDNRALISSQHVQVKQSWEKPGVYLWGSNTGRVTAPDSEELNIKNPRRLSFFDGQVLRDLKLGRDFAGALGENGDLYQWGSRFAPGAEEPRRTLAGKDLISIELSEDRVIALSSSGKVYSVPASQSEQETGPKRREYSWVPFWSSASSISYRTIQPQLSAFERITDISSGLQHMLLLTSSGRVFSAVSSSTSFPSSGQLGIPGLTWKTRPTAGPYDQPHELATLRGFIVKQVASGDLHSLVLDAEGRVFAFGDNSSGQLGQQPSSEMQAIDVPSLLPTSRMYAGTGQTSKVTRIAAGGSNSFFLIDSTRVASLREQSSPGFALGRTFSDVWACGEGMLGQLGTGRWTHNQGPPVKIKSLSGLFEYDENKREIVPIRVARLSVGATHSAATLANITYLDAHAGTSDDDTNWGADVLWWGGNEHWQLGTGKRNNCALPVYIGPLGGGDGKEKRQEHRLHVTPRKRIQLAGRSVSVEQRVECGRFVSAIYSGK